MKISVVFAYYNRRPLLLSTLRSIAVSQYNCELEIVIVDDASTSEHTLEDIGSKFPDLDINLITVPTEAKTWINPCVPNNIGIDAATGDVIVLQNPECYHVGNVLEYVAANIQANKYLVFGTYAIDQFKTQQLLAYDCCDGTTGVVGKVLAPMANVPVAQAHGGNKWYQHSKYSPSAFNFCAAITRADIDDLGGFDERYAYGIAKDDKEFLLRVRRKGLDVVYVDDPFVIHQWHPYTDYSNKELVVRNTRLYEALENSTTYKVFNKGLY